MSLCALIGVFSLLPSPLGSRGPAGGRVDFPLLFEGIEQFGEGYARTQGVGAERNGLVGVVHVDVPAGQPPNYEGHWPVVGQFLGVLVDVHQGGVLRGPHHLDPAREVREDGFLDYPEQGEGSPTRADFEAVEELDCKAGELPEGPGCAGARVHLNQDTVLGVDEDLQQPGAVQRGVEEGEEALVGDVGAIVSEVLPVLGEEPMVVIPVEELVRVPHLGRLQPAPLKNHNKPSHVFAVLFGLPYFRRLPLELHLGMFCSLPQLCRMCVRGDSIPLQPHLGSSFPVISYAVWGVFQFQFDAGKGVV
eukprot:Sspe_Gene.65904::Locus_38966_Transcript_1_1_Confidence_1.000_Length_1240::g.65904::m.65904